MSAFLKSWLWSIPLLVFACGKTALDRPEDVLSRIRLDCSSILGYARISVDPMLQAKPFLHGGEEERVQGSLDGLFPLADILAQQCKPGSHLILVFIDSTIFGGPFALRFEPIRSGALVEVLDRDPRFQRIPGSDPPEFERLVERRFHERIAGLLTALGVTGPWAGVWVFDRFLVEETPLGTLLMPSYDVRGDFTRFLEETDCLAPWGEADVVVNLEMLRLVLAYADLIEAWDRSYREFIAKLEQALGADQSHYKPLFRLARFLPTLTLETMKSIEGIRYVSDSPASGSAELCIETAVGSGPAEFLSALREDTLDLVGLVPAGMAIQWNIDPAAMGGLLKRFLSFYADETDLDRAFIDEKIRSLLALLAQDTGRYLAGLGGALEGGYAALIASRETEEAGAGQFFLTFPASKAEIALKTLFPETDFPTETLPGFKGGRRIENPWPLPDRVPLPIPAVETACSAGLEITTLQFGSGQAKGVLTGKLSRLARMGMGTIQTMPTRAALAIRVSIPAPIRSFIPGIEKIVPHEIIGSGSVEQNRLTFRFTSDRN